MLTILQMLEYSLLAFFFLHKTLFPPLISTSNAVCLLVDLTSGILISITCHFQMEFIWLSKGKQQQQ